MKKALIILMVTSFACTEQLEVVPYDYPQIFAGVEKKAWSIRNYQFLQEGKAPRTEFLDDCSADDLYIFYMNDDRLFELRNNDEKCAEEDPDLIVAGNWSFSNSGASMTLPFPLLYSGGPLPMILRNAEEEEMTLEFFYDEKTSIRFNFKVAELE